MHAWLLQRKQKYLYNKYFFILDPYPVIDPSGGEVNVLENQEAPLRIQIFALAAYKLSPINEKANISVVIESGKKIYYFLLLAWHII